MLKYALLAGAMTIAAPALAQTTPPAPTAPKTAPAPVAPPQTATPPATTPTAPIPPATMPVAPPPNVPAAPIAADTAPATPAPLAPDGGTTAMAPVAATPAAALAAPTAGAQVAGIVSAEFGSYDRNKDGKLSKAEFAAWTLALRKAADPTLKNDAANRSWTTTAFGQADADKSHAISKDEMTNFLAHGTSKAS